MVSFVLMVSSISSTVVLAIQDVAMTIIAIIARVVKVVGRSC